MDFCYITIHINRFWIFDDDRVKMESVDFLTSSTEIVAFCLGI